MRIPRLPLLTFSLVLGLFAWTTHPALAAEITCGSVLGPGGTFVLNRDLTCPFTPDPEDLSAGDPVLTVIAGATLDLNGHTVRCSGRGPGMHVYRATVLNGTVIGCREGVYVGGSGSVVQGMTVKRNGSGIYLQGAEDNLIVGNIAIRNGEGFGLEDGSNRNTLRDNTAKKNSGSGFYADAGTDNVFIDNTSVDNGKGFTVVGDAASRLVRNIASRNQGVGFWFELPKQMKLIANVAEDNQSHGFSLENLGYVAARVVLRDNVAQRNGGDGFVLGPAFDAPGDPSENRLTNNYAIGNKGHGIHIIVRPTNPGQLLFLHATISGNTALGHTAPHLDLADDHANCQEGTVWQDNSFLTASQSCIQ